MVCRAFAVLCVLILSAASGHAQGRNAAPASDAAAKPLQIYVVDTEGGKAALWISPTGETLLIDSGNPGGRDTDRIMAAIEDAGVKKIDYLLTTHYHVDHVGGMQALTARIPVGTFVDHGPTVEGPVNPALREQVAGFQAWYAEAYGKTRHLVVKPGDLVPITGLNWRIVTSAGETLKTALPGAGQANAACAETQPKEILTDPENAQSVGSLVTLGEFRAIDLGDLLWNKEMDLMCPTNKVGTVDLYMVSHHGTSPSGSPALVRGLQPRAAVMQNGTRKGGALDAMMTMRTTASLEDIWQLHWSYTAGIEQNSAGVFIANLEDPAALAAGLTAPAPARGGGGAAAHTPAYWIKISANRDGSFTITNSRNDFSKTYPRRTR